MGDTIAPSHCSVRTARRAIAVSLLLALVLAPNGGLWAFPLVDVVNQNNLPVAADLAAPDAQDLRHQLQIANGVPGFGGTPNLGWTFQPRIGYQFGLTDNALQVHAPRQWDLINYLSPGFSLAGATQRVQAHLEYAPVLSMYARTASQNGLNQQLNGTGNVTLIEELAFIDIRALAGLQSATGAAGGGGTLGGGDIGGVTAGAGGGGALQAGAARRNQMQTATIGLSPYLLRKFGDYGTLKLGYSTTTTQTSQLSGFHYVPIPVGGGSAGGQSLQSQEQLAEFRSGDILGSFQDTASINFTQSNTVFQAATGITGTAARPGSTQSTREIFSNKLSYVVNRELTVNTSLGHAKIVYGGANHTTIDAITWQIGATVAPNPDSQITFGYGSQTGTNSFMLDGRYQLTPRTVITASYNESLGTQLEALAQQLNNGVIGPNGGFINGQTGGPLFNGANNGATQPGLFHTTTMTIGATTQWNRDTFTLTLNATNSEVTAGTAATAAAGQTATKTTASSFRWVHMLRADLTMNSSVSYSMMTGGITSGTKAIAFNTGLQYNINDSLTATARYTYYQSTSPSILFSYDYNILIFGITKSF